MNRRVALATALFLLGTAVPPAFSKAADMVVSTSYPELTEAQRSLTTVPFATDAPAVVLLSVRQEDWNYHGAVPVHRTTYFRRIKILGEAGVKEHGDFSLRVPGRIKAEQLEARTILPDGTIIDAREAVHESYSVNGTRLVSVAFPKVRVGAILDVLIRLTDEVRRGFTVEPFMVDDTLPAIETRLVLLPPKTLQWRAVTQGIDRSQSDPAQTVTSFGKAFVWSFANVAPLPDEANRPFPETYARMIYIMRHSMRGKGETAHDWKQFRDEEGDWWIIWMKRMHRDLDALAEKVAGKGTTALEKAEAIRVALQERVHPAFVSNDVLNEQPDGALSTGKATTGEMAALASIMLRAVDVPSVLGSTRRRSSGPINPAIVMPDVFDDVILRFDSPTGPRWWSPATMVPAGELPLDLHGVLVLPHDSETEKPMPIPGAKPGDNRIARATTGRLDVSGSIEAETVMTFSTLAAQPWRAGLRRMDDAGRREWVRRSLQRHVPGAEVTALKIDGLDNGEFKLTYSWKAENVATVAGNRLLLKPLFHDRVAVEEWPDRPRRTNIALGDAGEVSDTVNLKLDDDVKIASATGPGRVQYQSNAVSFEYMADSWSHKVVARRSLKLQFGDFPSTAYSSLRALMVEAAQAEDKPVVITLADE